jgi:hypothetical protein
MQIECGNCNVLNAADSAFCGNCGALLSPTGPREGEGAQPAEEAPEAKAPQAQEPGDLMTPLEEAMEPQEQEPEDSVSPPEEAMEPQEQEPEDSVSPPEEATEPQEDEIGDAVRTPEAEELDLPGPPEEEVVEPSSALDLDADDLQSLQVAESLPGETVYYRDETTSITSERAVLEAKTLLLPDIESVSMEAKRAGRIPSILLALVGAFLAVLALTNILGDPILGLILTAGGLVLLGIGITLAITAKTEYIIWLGTDSGPVQALASPDQGRAEAIVQALGEALGEQGDPGSPLP